MKGDCRMKIVVATRNNHKLTEFRRILEPLGYEVVQQEEVCPGIEVVEDGKTFSDNAKKKAMEIFKRVGIPSIADDSGLCVEALEGEPGVYSARYAGSPCNDEKNNQKLLQNMSHIPKEMRGAYFASTICCVLGAEDIIICEGRCYGIIGYQPKGENGFGYDPLFFVGEDGSVEPCSPDGLRSFAELSAGEKDAISHRGVALRTLEQEMKKREQSKK